MIDGGWRDEQEDGDCTPWGDRIEDREGVWCGEMGAWAAPVAVLGMLSSVDTTDSPFEAERENYTGSIAEVVATDIGTDNSGSMVVGVRYMDMGHFVSDDR